MFRPDFKKVFQSLRPGADIVFVVWGGNEGMTAKFLLYEEIGLEAFSGHDGWNRFFIEFYLIHILRPVPIGRFAS